MSAGGTLITFDVIYYYVTLELHQNDFCVRKSQTHFPRSGDVIHPQLWESGSGYETIARELATLESEGVEAFDAYSNENVLFMACGGLNSLCCNGDFPTAQLLYCARAEDTPRCSAAGGGGGGGRGGGEGGGGGGGGGGEGGALS